MKVVALVSGGKDSCYAMMKCVEYGHQIVALANLLPADDSVDELDSYMYQTVGHQMIVCYAQCMGLPLFRRRIQGSTRNGKLNYKRTAGDEVEDMFILLNEVKKQVPSVSAVSSGAIASDYQRLRVESVCSRLGLISLAYLWKQDQSLLLHEMITKGIMAITVKVAAMGLDPARHLGKELEVLEPYLHKLKDLYGINVCGEGGEYETLTLDCPLFINARIVLDEYQVVLHSSDSIAPVGVLQPLRFHLEKKASDSIIVNDKENNQKVGFVFEVQGESSCDCGIIYLSPPETTDIVEVSDQRLHISTKEKDDAFSISCWLEDSSESSMGLQEDLKLVLGRIEMQLLEYGLGWEHVIYVHLYIYDMKEFAVANETYVRFITQDRCPFGVPSRSTIELPLQKTGLGKAYVEVLVAKDQSKKVLHVQSISCWAPSCIGPYSQATLHRNILHMAGQLGLDPPTMVLHKEGPPAELEQALKNSEAVANYFNCSISNSAILFVVYCSVCIPSNERGKIDEMLNSFLEQNRLSCTEKKSKSVLLDAIFIHVLVPDLPKSALVEVKPILYVPESMETVEETLDDFSGIAQSVSWGFQPADWHDSCIQKCLVEGKFCAVVICITSTIAAKVCSRSLNDDLSSGDNPHSISEDEMKSISIFCLHILNKVISGNKFSWEDASVLRIYFRTDLRFSLETLSTLFRSAFVGLAEMNHMSGIGMEPFFNLVPVLGSGPSASSMNAMITCELFAQRC